ncbi:MAG: MaoC family dehydratase N-terminal domain-containing protein [Actinobacteria bacterium]|nr:MaoC family dehydratase N-terminal domain-containing protein [Actinomycetota bacterium]
MGLADLADRVFGPRPLTVSMERVGDFVDLTGDDPTRWTESAPPGFAAAALFSVAPELLAELSGQSVVHGEQTFSWHRPLEVGQDLEVIGRVGRVRERGGVHYVGFDVDATRDGEVVVEGGSLFLVSGESTPIVSGLQHTEPPYSHDGDPDPDQRSASRADLVRYAGITRDWNPIHWDHEAAVVAGLPGVVVHGLLQASWVFAAAAMLRPGPTPLRSGRVRFRSPLLPARPVTVLATPEESELAVTVSDPDQDYLSARVVLADE